MTQRSGCISSSPHLAFTLPDGKYLNEVLISQGFAYADLRFAHSFYNKYKSLQERAKKKNKGLWKNVTSKDLPQWLRNKRPKLLEQN